MPDLTGCGASCAGREVCLMNGNADGTVRWCKSRACVQSPDCVEVAIRTRGVAVRDSKDPAGPVLEFTLAEWAAFVAGVRDGQFDVLT